jgi:hypothetical protein
VAVLVQLIEAVDAFQKARSEVRRSEGEGACSALLHGSFPPASEREARMDDPTRRCENDTDNETRPQGLPVPSGGLTYYLLDLSVSYDAARVVL